MSIRVGETWQWEGWCLEGLSLSGVRTSISLPQLGFTWDVAQGFPFAIPSKTFFITHGHMDHAAGIPYILSQKAMYSQPKPTFYMPESLISPMTKIIRLWEEIEKHSYDFEFLPARDQISIELSTRYDMEPFRTIHRIDSCGYTLIEKKRKLKSEYQNLSEDQIRELRKKQIEIAEDIRTPLISFTGDTQIEFLDVSPQVKNSKVLIMECTYLDERKTRQNAKEWGHTHLDELIERLDEINSEKILLIHISSRYPTADAWEIIRRKIPKKHLDRIDIFPGR